MKNSLALVYGDVLAFRWLALSGLYVLLCRLKRDAVELFQSVAVLLLLRSDPADYERRGPNLS